jgi:hypothetical protein
MHKPIVTGLIYCKYFMRRIVYFWCNCPQVLSSFFKNDYTRLFIPDYYLYQAIYTRKLIQMSKNLLLFFIKNFRDADKRGGLVVVLVNIFERIKFDNGVSIPQVIKQLGSFQGHIVQHFVSCCRVTFWPFLEIKFIRRKTDTVKMFMIFNICSNESRLCLFI